MALQYKNLQFEAVDALQRANHAQLRAVNARVEVPTLVDGGTIVVNSADIVCYLEHQYPDQPLYPAAPRTRVHATEDAPNIVDSDIERDKIFWRGDRIEWMLARGFHEWFVEEIRA